MMQNMCAKDAIGFSVGDDLDHAFHVIAAKRAAVSTERKSTNPYFNPLLLGLIFRKTDARELGIGVYDIGNRFVVHVAGFARNNFQAGDSFVFSFVSQHGSSGHIANGINTFDVRAVMLVHFDAFLFIQRYAYFFRAHTIREWPTAD